ncbi:MAG: DUF4276 family protein [Defluviitaleaceae bacterium]|nr:DUF4276 family protein [Defluviitaleaceae bacterium]
MKFLVVCCEGQTEEVFVEQILSPHFHKIGVFVTSNNMKGISSYKKMEEHIKGFCLANPTAFVTTMVDYYGLKKDVPGLAVAVGDIYQKSESIEIAVNADMHRLDNLHFNLIVHEFEGLLFSDVSAFEGIANKSELAQLRNEKGNQTPEHINGAYATAPSRRILKVLPKYIKTIDGIEVAKRIGLEKMAQECLHFGQWLKKIEDWAKGVA